MRRSVKFLAIVGVVTCLTPIIHAELIEFKFSGTVDQIWGVMEAYPHPWDRVKVGDSWSFQFSFESTTPPYYSGTDHADYYSVIKAYSFQMGDVHFTSRSPDYEIIEVMNNWPTSYDPEHDRYTVCIRFSDGSYFTMYLGGPGTCLDSLALPLCGDINLNSFTSFAFGSVYIPDPDWGLDYRSIAVLVTEHACVLTTNVESVATDTTWRGIGPAGNQEGTSLAGVGLDWEAANPGWNSSLTFDDSDAAGWKSCINNRESPYIWVDGPYASGSSPSYYRKVFELSGTPSSATLSFGVDDDAIIYINGQMAVSDTDGAPTDSSSIDVTSLLVPGTNLIAVKAHDSGGYEESFKATLDVSTPLGVFVANGPGRRPKADPPTPVPGPSERGAGRAELGPPVYEPSIVAVLANPSTASEHITLKAEFFSLEEYPTPPRGQYDWSIVSGDHKVEFMGFPGDYHRPSVGVQPIAASTSRNDVKIKVEFTSWTGGVPSCEAYFYMTVVKPTSIRVVEGYPTPTEVFYNGQGRVVGYLVDYAFQVCDQFGEPIPVAGMQVREEMNVLSRTHRIISPRQFETYWTNGGGVWVEQLGTPRPLYTPIPDNYYMEVEQKINVEGWLVATRRQTYHHGYATSE